MIMVTPTQTSNPRQDAKRSYENTALEKKTLKSLDYKRYINETTPEDELPQKCFDEIKANHVNTADELMDINKRIYTAEQKLLDEKKKQLQAWRR